VRGWGVEGLLGIEEGEGEASFVRSFSILASELTMEEAEGRAEGLNSVQWWMKRIRGAISGGRSDGSDGRVPVYFLGLFFKTFLKL
jgi:hypothetical protein